MNTRNLILDFENQKNITPKVEAIYEQFPKDVVAVNEPHPI